MSKPVSFLLKLLSAVEISLPFRNGLALIAGFGQTEIYFFWDSTYNLFVTSSASIERSPKAAKDEV